MINTTYIHFCKEYNSSIKGEAKKELITEKVRTVLSTKKPENLNSVDRFHSEMFVVKLTKTNLCRIIVQLARVDLDKQTVSVYFVRDYIAKKNFDYQWGHKVHHQLKNGDWLSLNPLSEYEITRFKSDFQATQNPFERKQQIPEQYDDWLHSFRLTLNFDIFEYEEWVQYSNNPTPEGLRDSNLRLFRRIIHAIIEPNHYLRETYDVKALSPEPGPYQIIDQEFELGVVFTRFRSENDRNCILIHGGADIKRQPELWESIKTDASSSVKEVTLEEVGRNAFRAYPKWVLNSENEELWIHIQRHKETRNYSLLPEQIEFLTNFKFPAYINGQAGSGKSTMLHYLFANVYLYQVANEFQGDILFLTENNELLKKSVEAIRGLLTTNPEFNVRLDHDHISKVGSKFKPIRSFLVELLPEDIQLDYGEENYLDFARFKERFNGRFDETKYSAEESWFAINTYTYGYFEAELIDTKEKYESRIPRNFRELGVDDFGDIIKESLGFYQNLLSEGLWDRVSLVRKIFDLYGEYTPQQYHVVFCDEAQDFTRIELRLITRSSEYTKYDLQGATQLPLVFAGDAMQTVSPVGFSDRRFHELWYSICKESNFSYDKNESTYNPTYNYRSTRKIVALANAIQIYREKALKEESTLIQNAKRADELGATPILHLDKWLKDEVNYDNFVRLFKYKSFIIPYDNKPIENLGEQLLEEDSLLNGKFPDVKSSIDAKGAEYSEVVVYKFGDYFTENFGELRWSNFDPDFNLKFFFNKLYVAVTRAQNELILIDSEEGIKKFWTPLLANDQYLSEVAEESNSDELVLFQPETGLTNIKESTPERAYENALVDMEQGVLDQNRSRLSVAANTFLILGKSTDAEICTGHKFIIEEDYEQAHFHFDKGRKFDLAADSLFQGQHWQKLDQYARKINLKHGELYSLLSKLMSLNIWSRKDLSRAYSLRHKIHELFDSIKWYDDFVQVLIKYSASITSSEERRELAFIVEAFVREENLDLIELLGQLYYDTKQFSQAVEIWDKLVYGTANYDFTLDYLRAKIQCAIDENSHKEELLWSGLIVLRLPPESEQWELCRRVIELASALSPDTDSTDVDIWKHLLTAKAVTGMYSELGEAIYKFEESTKNPLLACDHYEELIHVLRDETIAAIMKERWARSKLLSLLTKPVAEGEAINELNKEFYEQSFPFDISNGSWTLKEIRSIPDRDTSLKSQLPPHIVDIKVERFKRFVNLELKELGQFNLVLGSNNSGKTSFLEALLFDPDPNVCFRNFLYSNQERTQTGEIDGHEKLFNNIVNQKHRDKGIRYTFKHGRRVFSYLLSGEMNTLIIEDLQGNRRKSELLVEAQNNLNQTSTINVPLIPFGKGYHQDLTQSFYDNIAKKSKVKKRFVQYLKLFIPRAIDVSVDPVRDEIIIEEDDQGASISSPLHHFGEGANKLFRILVQMFVVKDGRLLIDEIDAGVHYSRFYDFWKTVVGMAKELNIQLFATTHNEECLEAFVEIFESKDISDYSDHARVITLDYNAHNRELIALVRTHEEMVYSRSSGLELRGRKL